ncbi:HAD family phosphatase [Carnobacterium viridans]|uniref:Haloacid dehalogenase superfamily, subfamily IA, variant 3 with third motif having DD or ED/haloacid dehalogenase superfamily, subfamily IA, variant 1 with third motif having Dx(3-4)D or Dx(3-4)E n=1 Tax=Carnobacterium viridans TaxID=174587 RepID=A0A1H1BN60_9LACT|nr:HAD family phosphatase [Carnobacterium viridans]UDE95717.1 HAD family phosphatase [Carnobacterium viridans]SDQ53394.1 haloacid dehalogenase superfamily, subfamily IA, variant 3 with third motif having DD or ED/haloacid dehalogenase superfamily, subfamily IA, variant 1 with third motif having Dx(3-4)D or Dx(3-4)E [Carnobacterium viridans]
MTKIEAVIFDMDGLMFDTEVLYYEANRTIAKRIDLAYTWEFHEKYIGVSDEEFHKELYLTFETEAAETLINEGGQALLEHVEVNGLRKKKGLIELLDYLESKNIKKIVASSSIKSVVSLFLEKEQLTSYFDAIIGGDEVTRAKPSPEIYEKAWLKTQVPKEHTLVLEDSLNGIRASYDANIPVIMIPDLILPTNEAKEKTLMILDDLNQVKTFIKQQNQ